MSTADVARPRRAGPAAGGPARRGAHWLRLLRSELGLVFGRRRNLALLAVLAAVPVLLGLVLQVSPGERGGGGGNGGPRSSARSPATACSWRSWPWWWSRR